MPGLINPIRLVPFVLVALALAFAGCGDVEGGDDPTHEGPVISDQGLYEAHVTPDPSPPQTGENELMMHVMTPEGDGVEGLTLTAEPWMPAHGHGSPEEPAVEEQGDGMYAVTNLVYSMPGRWEVRVAIEGAPGSDTLVLKYSVQ
jgi:hypothetical protein